ncbi:DUF2637 domain-containing protein [Actinoplanes sp. NPDC049118]|uniref:DUF2637 domain-containing protein n=1 Tax=Actinoplanes sp. NPDC049118 TaxID=3155769 RepID=UPI0033E76366
MSNTSTGERVESALLALILAVVAIAAGWASFTHVHDWTMRHVPAGTPSAFGWVNAVISELVPVAAFLTIRRRRRSGASIAYPVVLLLASAALSLAAQLAVASRSPSGWLLSAVPALAFMALVKLVFATSADSTPPSVEPPVLPVGIEPQAEPEPVPSARIATAVVPVPAGAFTRRNGNALTPEANNR